MSKHKKKIQKKDVSDSGKQTEDVKSPSLSFRSKIESLFRKEYKKMAILPSVVTLIALLLIFAQFARTGDFFNKGISLKGGTTIQVVTHVDIAAGELEEFLSEKFPGEEFAVRVLRKQGVVAEISIETSVVSESVEDIIPYIEERLGEELDESKYSVQTIGGSLSESFFNEVLKVLLVAFVLMGIVVYVTFRSPIPSIVVVLGALSDLIITLAIINIMGVKISSAGIAAFLMLIDYSIDTDTLVAARMLKREEGTSVFDAMMDAFGTGIAMSAAALVAMGSAYIFSTSAVIKEIMIILIVGLVVDLAITWIQNASMIMWYVEAKAR
ncbi:MAG: hypothetical protein ABIG95_01765 [Candidatus Woesearchaeota archaeon]